MSKRAIVWLSVSIMIFIAFGFWVKKGPSKSTKITNFVECVESGNLILESYPRQCVSGNLNFVEDIGNVNEKIDLIQVNSPIANSVVSSPLVVSGMARGNWYFEANFPIYLYGEDGSEVAVGFAQSEGEWMTPDFVPFSATLVFDNPNLKKGELVFKKNNPSGLPENEDELRYPVLFE